MKISAIRSLLFILLIVPAATFAAPKETVLIDLTEIHEDRVNNTVEKNWEYAFMDWDKKINNIAGRGALVKAPSGKGGFGENNTMARFGKNPAIQIVFTIGNGNQAKAFQFSLEDKDGTIFNWTIPLENAPRGKELHYKIDVSKNGTPDKDKPGKKPGLDLNKIHAWQIKGDWQDGAVEVLYSKVITLQGT